MPSASPPRSQRHIRRLGPVITVLALALLVLPGAAPPTAAPATNGTPEPPAATVGSAASTTIPAFRQANEIAVLTIHGDIDRVTLRSLERRIAAAQRDGADAVVLDIDTPGGRADITLDICNLLKDTSETPANTVAWIHPQAYSAGTIIALACREIVVAPNSTFGDAAPISPLVPLPAAERAKAEAPLLAEVIDSARRHHYDENLVQAFIAVGVELWLIENTDTGAIVFVDRVEYERVFGEEPPKQITAGSPVSGRAVVPWVNKAIERPAPGQGDAMTPEQVQNEILWQQQLPAARSPLTEADRGDWRLITQVVSNERLLTVKQAEALQYGLAAETVANDQALIAFFGGVNVTRYDQNWAESLVRFLETMPVRVILIIIFLVGLFVEMAAPGVGLFGALALGAMAVLLGSSFILGLAQWWDIALIAAGLILVALELFVIPGLGIAGFGGAICLLAGLVGLFWVGDLGSAQAQSELGMGLVTVLTALFGSCVGIWLISRQLKSFPLFNRMILHAEVGQTERPGLLQSMAAPKAAGLETGDVGEAISDLRPAGRARFGEQVVDVQSLGRYIDRGASVRVVNAKSYVIEVEAVDS